LICADAIAPLDERLRAESSLAYRRPATASSTLAPAFAPERAVDGDPTTFWARAIVDRDPWFEIDLVESRTIGQVELELRLDEVRFGDRRPLSLWVEDAEGCRREILKSQVYGAFWSQRFEPVVARRVRVCVDAPGLRTFRVVGADSVDTGD
jgi:hypothetical protein